MKEYLHLFEDVSEALPTENGDYWTNIGERIYQDGTWFYEEDGLFFIAKGVTHWLDLSKLTTKERALFSKQPWDLLSVLAKLVEAAEILLHKNDYDGHGWEEIVGAVGAAKDMRRKIFMDETRLDESDMHNPNKYPAEL